jgi:hypothetical protein
VALAATATTARPLTTNCGSTYRGLKTLSDPQRNLVNVQPRDTTLAAIAPLPRPNATPTTRNTALERQVAAVGADHQVQAMHDNGALGVDQAPITRWGIDPAETLAGMSLAVASLTNSDRRDRHSYSF